MIAADPPLVPGQTFTVPKPPSGQSAAARQMADALRECASEIVAAQRLAHRVLDDSFRCWTGSSATAMHHPLHELDGRTRRVERSLHAAADQLDHYARVLDEAHRQHGWSLGKILTVAAVVATTSAVVVVTLGAATPAAAAIDSALVAGEVAAAATAATAASAAALQAAEAVTLAVRALQGLRAVATFVRPQIALTAAFADVRAYTQVRDTGHLDVSDLVGSASLDLAFGATGERAAGLVASFGLDAANPVVRWMLPKLATSAVEGGMAGAEQLLVEGSVDAGQVAEATANAFGGAVAGDLASQVASLVGAVQSSPAPRWKATDLPDVLQGSGALRRTIDMRPRARDRSWGLTKVHVRKHFFGDEPLALVNVDPGGTPDIWLAYLSDLVGRPATLVGKDGVLHIHGVFPRSDGNGTFKLGIKIFPTGGEDFDLVTVLTRQ